jgi:hypothetical protein
MRIASTILLLLLAATCNPGDGGAEPYDRSLPCGGQDRNRSDYFDNFRLPVGPLVLVLSKSGSCVPIENVIWPIYRVSVAAQEPAQGEPRLFDLSPVISTKILIYRETRTVFVVEGDSFKEIVADGGAVQVRTLFSTGQHGLYYTALPRLGTIDAAPQSVSPLDPDFPVEVTSARWLSFGEDMLFDLRSRTLHRFDPTAGGALRLWSPVGLAPRERTLFWLGGADDDSVAHLVATDLVSGTYQLFALDPRQDDLPYVEALQFHTAAIDGAWIARHFRSEPQADGSVRITRRPLREVVPRGMSSGVTENEPILYELSCFKPSLRAAVADLLRTKFQARLIRTKRSDSTQDMARGQFACGSADALHGFQYMWDEYEIDGVPIVLTWDGYGALTIRGELPDNEPAELRWRVPARTLIIKAIADAIDARLAGGTWRHHLQR